MIEYKQMTVDACDLANEMNYLTRLGYDIFQVLPRTYYNGTDYIIIYFRR